MDPRHFRKCLIVKGGRVAQVVEQCPFKAWVAGSNPAALTKHVSDASVISGGFPRLISPPFGCAGTARPTAGPGITEIGARSNPQLHFPFAAPCKSSRAAGIALSKRSRTSWHSSGLSNTPGLNCSTRLSREEKIAQISHP